MGRGRAKAKQTKVARDLKYRTHETDFGALAKELHGDEANEPVEPEQTRTEDDSGDSAAAGDPDEAGDDGPWSDYSRRD